MLYFNILLIYYVAILNNLFHFVRLIHAVLTHLTLSRTVQY